jgi:lipopolysaccharide transport system ATP-binding protein
MSDIVAKDVCLDFEVYSERHRTLKETILNITRKHTLRQERKVVPALKKVSFRITHGERVSFLGHNGAGKSTLLRTIAGIYRPTSGSIRCTGRILPLLQAAGSFNPELTGRENIIQASALMRIPPPVALGRVDEILEFAELSDYADVPVKYYSLGMTTRLAFSTLTSEAPDILLLDESLVGGDLNFMAKANQRLDEFMSSASTILMVSHDLTLVERLSTRVIWLDDGYVVADGDPSELIARYRDASPFRRQKAA